MRHARCVQGVEAQWVYVCTDGRAEYDANSQCVREVAQRAEVMVCVNKFRSANTTTDAEK